MSKQTSRGKTNTKKTKSTRSSVHIDAVEEGFGLDPQIVFEVEGVVFGLPRSQLMASELFRDMLGDERLGGPKEGTEENPIRIEKISSVSLSQVKAFCKVMNWRGFDAEPTLSPKQWYKALHLATMWGFKSLREYIIGYLDSLVDDPLWRIYVADYCDVKEWLHPAYAKLCAQETSLTVREGEVLGLQRFAALCRIREQGLKNGGNSGHGGCDPRECPCYSSPFNSSRGPPSYFPLPWVTPRSSNWNQQPFNQFRDYRGSDPVQEVPNCQQKCCKPRFKLDAREQKFLEMIEKEKDLYI